LFSFGDLVLEGLAVGFVEGGFLVVEEGVPVEVLFQSIFGCAGTEKVLGYTDVI
jgi:hypothetical protein